jgi:non-lysosomal glucosylceramidase
VKSVRDRYDGEKRNPWNELECGSNYARSMASYALLNAFSGFEFDMTQKIIGFNPLTLEESFKCFWSLDSGWGEVVIDKTSLNLKVHYGQLELKIVHLPFAKNIQAVILNNKPSEFDYRDGYVQFAKPLIVRQEEGLEVKME